jgi:hypothetical protein
MSHIEWPFPSLPLEAPYVAPGAIAMSRGGADSHRADAAPATRNVRRSELAEDGEDTPGFLDVMGESAPVWFLDAIGSWKATA